MTGTHRVTVDAFRGDLLSPAPLQRFVYAQYERSIRRESFHQQLQQDTARFPARPCCAAQDPMIAAESPFLLQTHRSQGAGYGPLARGDHRTSNKQLDMLEDAFGEQWRDRGQHLYIVVGRVRISITSSLADCGDERTLPLSLSNGQSP